jgi:hypothetical protein
MKVVTQFALGSLVALALAGCNTSAPPAGAGTATSGDSHEGHDHEGHAHGEHGAGPHDGTIGEFGGGKYHIEFVVDHEKQEATVYVLGEDVKTPAPLKTDKLTLAITEPAASIELAAQPLEGEAAGESSRFVGTHEALGKEQEFAGTVTAEVEGTPYEGEFKQEAHSHAPKP